MISARFVKKSSAITCVSVAEYVLTEIRANQSVFGSEPICFEVVDYRHSEWVVVFGEFPKGLEKFHADAEFIDLYYFDECAPYLTYIHRSGDRCIRRIGMSTHGFDKERIDINDGEVEDWDACPLNSTMHSAYDRIVMFFGLLHPYNQKITEPRLRSALIKITTTSGVQKVINVLRYGSRVSVVQVEIIDTTHVYCSTRISASSSGNAKYRLLFEDGFLSKELLESTYVRPREIG